MDSFLKDFLNNSETFISVYLWHFVYRANKNKSIIVLVDLRRMLVCSSLKPWLHWVSFCKAISMCLIGAGSGVCRTAEWQQEKAHAMFVWNLLCHRPHPNPPFPALLLALFSHHGHSEVTVITHTLQTSSHIHRQHRNKHIHTHIHIVIAW